MKPTIFYYERISYMDSIQLIELIEGKIRLQDTPMGVTIIDGFVFAEPTQQEWKDFYQSVKNLNLIPKDPEEQIMDGFEVNCHIAFNEDLIKFHIINPRFNKFEEFETLVNSLTKCEDYPSGVLHEEGS